MITVSFGPCQQDREHDRSSQPQPAEQTVKEQRHGEIERERDQPQEVLVLVKKRGDRIGDHETLRSGENPRNQAGFQGRAHRRFRTRSLDRLVYSR